MKITYECVDVMTDDIVTFHDTVISRSANVQRSDIDKTFEDWILNAQSADLLFRANSDTMVTVKDIIDNICIFPTLRIDR